MNLILAQSGLLPGRLDFVLYGMAAVVLLVFGILLLNFGMIYIRALFSGPKVTFTELIALRLRSVPVGMVVDSRITAVKSGLPLTIDDLPTHFLAGGSVPMVVLALIAAKKAGINLGFENGLIERVASPIPRRDYYRFKEGGWILYMRQWLALMRELHKIAERGLTLIAEKPVELQERLLEAHDLFSLMEEHFPAMLETLEQERQERTGA